MRFLGAMVLVAVVASAATADMAWMRSRQIPHGKKYIRVYQEVQLGKGVTGYLFVQHNVADRVSVTGDTFSKLELSDAEPVRLVSDGTREVRLVAVPVEVAKAYSSDAELFRAVGAKQVKGSHSLNWLGGGSILIDETATTESKVMWTITITGVDPKDGIRTKTRGFGIDPPEPQSDEKKPLALAEPGYLVGGIAVALSITLSGLWLARRWKG